MLCAATHPRRRAAIAVESAIILPLVLLLVLGLIIGGMGIFRYQEVASMAREATRYASVRGANYASEKQTPAATAEEIYEEVLKPRAAAMDLSRLPVPKVEWSDPSKAPLYFDKDQDKFMTNTVTVTVTYTWVPELFLVGPITLQSSSTMVVTY